LELLSKYRDLGVERVVFSVPSETAEAVWPHLDEIGELMMRVGGEGNRI